MASKQAIVAAAVGLHARPATLFVKAVTNSGVRVLVGRPGQKAVDARSVLLVMSLGIKCGEPVELSAEGEHAGAVLDDLAALLEQPEQPE